VKLALGNDDHMPPAKEPQPTAAEIAALVAWVRSGATSAVLNREPSTAQTPSTAPTRGHQAPGTPTPGATPTPAASAPAAAETPAVTQAPPPAATQAPPPAATTADGGAPDPALLKDLPQHVALFPDAVQPLFREKCGKCHIKDKPAGGLNVAEHAQLLEGGFSGPGIVPKDRKASFVMQRLVLPPSDDEHMPPEGEPVLSADEIELVGSWIDQGAPARGPTETARLTAGAARALSARGVKGTSAPPSVAAQAGGCAACSVPGAPQSKLFGLQALCLFAAASLIVLRRATRVPNTPRTARLHT
jgi:hypothetical protein